VPWPSMTLTSITVACRMLLNMMRSRSAPVVGRGHVSLLTSLYTWHCRLCTDMCYSLTYY
jgi:hypothetical protein